MLVVKRSRPSFVIIITIATNKKQTNFAFVQRFIYI